MTDKKLFGNSEQLNDTISRRGAIKAIKDALLSWSNMPGWRDNKIVGALDKLPSAQQEQKKGRWLPDNRPGGGFWVCSCCKFPSEAFAANVLYKFCPNCRADMRGEHDG